MKIRKFLPWLFIILLGIVAVSINGYNNKVEKKPGAQKETQTSSSPTRANTNPGSGLDRHATHLFFSKHAKCRMKCRHITQQEVKDILVNGSVNYNKSNLQDPRGATYAVEGITSDKQRVRIIFAPRQQHMTVVTVIDLDREYECDCN